MATEPKTITKVNASATQTEYPQKATIRTFFQALIPSLGLFLVAAPVIVNIILDEFARSGVTMPGWAYAALTGLAVACALVSSIISRVMAIPGVEKWLREKLPVLSAAPSHPEFHKDDAFVDAPEETPGADVDQYSDDRTDENSGPEH